MRVTLPHPLHRRHSFRLALQCSGGIGPGNNYPLRGMKVLNWEGGIHGTAFVRGTNSDLAPLPAAEIRHQLMHSTDWLPTLAGVAHSKAFGPLPLDGFDQWASLRDNTATSRTFIVHNMPLHATPVNAGNTSHPSWTSSACMTTVDNRTDGRSGPGAGCHPFGVTGAAIRKGDYKMLITYPGAHPWEDSSPAGTPQYVPGGRFPNGSAVFTPSTNDTIPQPYNGTYFLFNISADPTESHNLAGAEPHALAEMLQFYNEYAAKSDSIGDLSWRWGFTDPTQHHNPSELEAAAMEVDAAFTCEGPFLGSEYCHYGHELDCFVSGQGIQGAVVGTLHGVANVSVCISSCAETATCNWWAFRKESSICTLHKDKGALWSCADCSFGPKVCPE